MCVAYSFPGFRLALLVEIPVQDKDVSRDSPGQWLIKQKWTVVKAERFSVN
ncbi:MAG: hypothetical protein KAX45_02675 [Chitinophagaceae bacterium]|nr:hypothetical protein [Chitinophagaceae bacterium]MBP8243421.1 hypothetical protein [Chitinophagaceae bacterium]